MKKKEQKKIAMQDTMSYMEAAELADVACSTITWWAQDGVLEKYKVLGRPVVSRTELLPGV